MSTKNTTQCGTIWVKLNFYNMQFYVNYTTIRVAFQFFNIQVGKHSVPGKHIHSSNEELSRSFFLQRPANP